jgi:hypothetical protein
MRIFGKLKGQIGDWRADYLKPSYKIYIYYVRLNMGMESNLIFA